MIDRPKDDDLLETFFDTARAAQAKPAPEALLANVARDAEKELAWRRARRPERTSVFRGLGGWPGLSGLVTATVVGIWLGVSMSSPILELGFPTPTTESDTLSMLLPDYNLGFEEEG